MKYLFFAFLVVLFLFTAVSVGVGNNVCAAQEKDDVRTILESPNSDYLAYALITDTTSVYCVSSTYGEFAPILVATLQNPAFVSEAAWSPDGQLIAFVVDSGEDRAMTINSTLHVVRPFGLHPQGYQLSASEIALVSHPMWSPNGQYVAYGGQVQGNPDTDIYISEIGYEHEGVWKAGVAGHDTLVSWINIHGFSYHNDIENRDMTFFIVPRCTDC